MSTARGPDDDLRRQAFLDSLAGGNAAPLHLFSGISLHAHNANGSPGLALQVAREALQTGQLQRALECRFEQAHAFDGCYIYLNAQGALVIWHALPAQRQALDGILSRMLWLANLETLDGYASR